MLETTSKRTRSARIRAIATANIQSSCMSLPLVLCVCCCWEQIFLKKEEKSKRKECAFFFSFRHSFSIIFFLLLRRLRAKFLSDCTYGASIGYRILVSLVAFCLLPNAPPRFCSLLCGVRYSSSSRGLLKRTACCFLINLLLRKLFWHVSTKFQPHENKASTREGIESRNRV